MSKSDEDEFEQIRKENRELKQTIRTLQKRIKKLDRGYNKTRNEKPPSKSDLNKMNTEVDDNDCPECGRGQIIATILANRVLTRCNNCDYRGKTKKI